MKKIAFGSMLATIILMSSVPAFASGPDKTVIGGSGNPNYPGTSVAVQPGDILVTDSTSSSGLTGHAGIVIDNAGSVASIADWNSHPEIYSMSTWWSRYPDERIIRPTSSYTSYAYAAANWASSFVTNNPNEAYGLGSSIDNPYTSTYCSKIVWDAYYFGNNHNVHLPTDMAGLCEPYLLSDPSNYGWEMSVSKLWSNF